ncbi:AfsR/SARP family transcriptional regulator [Aquabacterium humicola]|uniref:AfsR/SARP family transcriptional regulator n=1 Tax=Aquabacterium humicola TaxID=3237377 RepID=UPI002543D12D|nr:NACHT domain-containing protein [Rubrivivax pictus]
MAAEAPWQLRLLGDLQLVGTAGPLRLPGRAAGALLARLASAPDRAFAREELIELLWPGVGIDVGRNRLRQVLSTLKSLLEPPGAPAVLQADRTHLRLVAGALDCDVPAFEAAWRARRVDAARALYRGELLPGFYDEWIVDERQRLAALADRLGEPAAAGSASLPASPPQRAPVHAPVHTPVAPSAPAARWSAPALPRYLTRLHGIEPMVHRLSQTVRRQRLVTVTGPGGHGKTRLAVELARRFADAAEPPFDTIAFVPLVDCRRGDALFDAVLAALRHEGRAGTPLQQLGALLGERRVLLVMDNLEQLADDGAPLIAEWLERLPGLHVLATSRRLLALDGEAAFVLPPLPLPPALDDGDDEALASNPAVALFIDRARAARGDFHLSRRNRDAVRALVRRLEGMPLAIELAAARVRSLAPAQLLALLEQAADAPSVQALALLARAGPRSGHDPRHASMLAVVQWSWQLLSAPARALLGALAVFAEGFAAPAAQAIAGEASPVDTALALDELVAHSMLRLDADNDRYHLPEPVRAFAAGGHDAATWAALRARHRRWVVAWASALPADAPLRTLRAELANLAAAIASARDDDAPDDAAALAAALQGAALTDLSLPSAALRALADSTAAMRLADDRSTTRAFVARALLRAGDPAGATALADAALAELPAAGLPRARVLARLAHLRWRMRRDPAVLGWLDEAQALAEAAGAQSLLASLLATRGAVMRPRDRAAAISLQRGALALWQQAGDRHGTNTGRANLAIALAESRDGCDEALALLDEVIADARDSGDGAQHAHASNARGEALLRLRRWQDAADAYRDCVRVAFALPEPLLLAYGLWNLPRALVRLRQPLPAARLMGFAERFAPLHCGPLGRADRRDLLRLRRLCARQVDAATLARAWRDGAACALADAVRDALG